MVRRRGATVLTAQGICVLKGFACYRETKSVGSIMWMVRLCIVLLLAGCVGTPDGPPMGGGRYLLSATEFFHNSESGLLDGAKENRAISGGGESCNQRVGEDFVRKMEDFARFGKPVASLRGMEWSHWGEWNGEPKMVGYVAIITGPSEGRVALTDVEVLETRDGRLFKLPEDVFKEAVEVIFAKLNGPNCPFDR
jgi:hypothetical protein